jgi:hypothetical protein
LNRTKNSYTKTPKTQTLWVYAQNTVQIPSSCLKRNQLMLYYCKNLSQCVIFKYSNLKKTMNERYFNPKQEGKSALLKRENWNDV